MRSHFGYKRPATPAEAVQMRAELGTGAKYWAGGTDITLQWQREVMKPDCCIDLTFLKELGDIDVATDFLRIGAMTTLASLERAAHLHPHLKTMSDVTKLMCTPQTRSIATVGGNMCNASPAADLSPLFVALDAEAVALGADGQQRTVAMIDFFQGVNKTVVSDGSLLLEIRIPLPANHRVGSSYRRIDRTVVDIALVNSSAAVTVDGTGKITAVRVALGAVAPVILRSIDAEKILDGSNIGSVPASLLEEAGQAAANDARPISDVRASADYPARHGESHDKKGA